MKVIQYRVLYADGHHDFVTVEARNLNTGLVKAVRAAAVGVPTDDTTISPTGVHSVEFWAVLS